MPVLSIAGDGSDRRPASVLSGNWAVATGLALLAGLIGSSAWSADGRELFQVTLDDPQLDYALLGAALSPDGATVEVLASRAERKVRSKGQALTWTRVTRAGRISAAIDLSAALPAAAPWQPGASATGDPLVALPGALMLLVDTAADGKAMLEFSAGGKAAAIRPLRSAPAGISIRAVVRQRDGKLLLAGSQGANPWLAEAQADGALLSQHRLEPQGAYLVRVVPEPDGSRVVLGEKAGAPESSTWIARIAPGGRVLAQASIPGRALDLARGTDGGYAVLSARIRAAKYDTVLTVLGPSLDKRLERTLLAGQFVITDWRIGATGSGQYVIAGVQNRGLWLSQVQPDGTVTWTLARIPEQRDDLEMVRRLELLPGGDTFFVVYSAYVVREREQRQVVRVLGVATQ